MIDPTLGVYVHVPFCERICPYCDFAVVRAPALPAETERRFVEAVLVELALRAPLFDGLRLETLYLGGGTPSRLAPESVGRIVEGVRERFGGPPAAALEITLEVNPSTLERARLAGFRGAGVNRLSIGVQSFDDAVLKRLGRAHRAAEAHATLAAARAAGFENVSLDLIFAAPGQSLAGFLRDVDEAIAVAPQHLSAYALTIEGGTPFALAHARDQLVLADEEETIAMLEQLVTRLEAAGLARYEVSNFAAPGRVSRHNTRYWARRPVLALGPGAHSTEPRSEGAPHGARHANPRELARWLACIEAGALAGATPRERLDPATARGEAMMLGLRTTAGVEAAAFAAEFGAAPDAFFSDEIAPLLAHGLLVRSATGDLRPTARGLLLADAIAACFVAPPPREPRS